MAHAVVDEAIRNVVAVGADPDRVALMDNFSWGDPRQPPPSANSSKRSQGCCDALAGARAPFVQRQGLAQQRVPRQRRRPPRRAPDPGDHRDRPGPRDGVAPGVVTPDLVAPATCWSCSADPTGSSVAATSGLVGAVTGPDAAAVPAPDPAAPPCYRLLHPAIGPAGSAPATTAARAASPSRSPEMALGGSLGVDCLLLAHADLTVVLFSESSGRFVCDIAPGISTG